MAKVNVFDLVNKLGQESISHPDVGSVTVAPVDAAKPVKEDVVQESPDGDVDAAVTDTKTTAPGPKDGGGDGTAQTVDAKNVKTHTSTKDLHFDGDQNGGRDIDTLPNKVNPKDGLKASDVSHSVESHDEAASEESKLKTIEAGGAEAVGEADDLVMDIDAEAEKSEATGILSQSETDEKLMGKILNEIGELETAKASVEGYIGLLDSMEKRGVEMSNELRTSISIGLKTISQELFEKEIVTLEEFRVSNEDGAMVVAGQRRDRDQGEFVDDDDTEFDGARDKTKKGLSGKLKQIWEAIKRAYFRSVSALVDLYNSFMTDTTKLAQHLKGLRSRVGKLEGGKEISMKNSTRLMLGDEFVGNSAEAIKRVTSVGNELLLQWPTRLVKIIEEVKKGTGMFSRGNKGGALQAFEDAIDQSFRNLKELSKNDRDKVPSGFLGSDSISWSEPLPGNRALYVGIKRHKGDVGQIKDITNFKDTVNINFSAVPAYETNSGEASVVTPDSAEALSVIKALEDLINQINGRKEGMVAIRKLAEEVKRSATGDLWMKGMTDDTIYNLILADHVGSVTTSSEHAFVGYLISMIKAYIGFLEGSIATEGSEGNNSKPVNG